MVEIEQELKDKLKKQRLEQYKSQLFNLEMDLSAYESFGDTKAIEQTKAAIEQGRKAYKAVEAM